MEIFQPHINYFAQTDFRGKRQTFGIKSEDRAKHIYVIGKTGMGKSTLLENMAIQDIKNGEGLCVIDPHGSMAEKLLDFVPENRIEDVIYFAPFDLDNPVAFNVMEDVGKDNRHLIANGLMATFKKIWPDVWSGRMEYILGNTILALLEYPDSTLLGVNRMLSDKAYRDKVVDNVSDPTVKAFWVDEFAKYNERYMQEAGDSIKNKIGQFTGNPLIRNIIGQPKSSFDVREVMDKKKILIINLSKGRVGEINANLLGGMIITKVYLSAMSRANLLESEIRKLPSFFFYVDEFQSFVNDSFADILSEARKYKLSLTIAHQYVDQMPETVRNAVFGNVGTTITFRVGPFDAEVLEKIFFPTFTKEDLVNLGFAQIYLTMMIDGVGSPPFSAVTLAPIPSMGPSYKEEIIAHSRKKFAFKRDDVEKVIVDWAEKRFGEESRGPSQAPRPQNGPKMTSDRRPEVSVVNRPREAPKPAPRASFTPKPQSTSAPDKRPPQANVQPNNNRPEIAKSVSLSTLAPKENPGAQNHKDELKKLLADTIAKASSGGSTPKKDFKANVPSPQNPPKNQVIIKKEITHIHKHPDRKPEESRPRQNQNHSPGGSNNHQPSQNNQTPLVPPVGEKKPADELSEAELRKMLEV